MKTKLVTIALAGLLLQACVPATIGPAMFAPQAIDYLRGLEPKRYLGAALGTMQIAAYFSDQVDWASVDKHAYQMVAGARTTADAYPAVEYAVSQLWNVDHHSFFFPPDRASTLSGSSGSLQGVGFSILVDSGVVVEVLPRSVAQKAGLRVGDVVETIDGKTPPDWVDQGARPGQHYHYFGYFNQRIKATIRHPGEQANTIDLQPGPMVLNVLPSGRSIGCVGYLHLPGHLDLNGSDAGSTAYAARLAQLVETEDRLGSCAWIIDLRQDWGGNFSPMAAGLGAFLGKQPFAQVVWKWGRQSLFGEPYGSYQLKHPDPPVAVLQGPTTASAGEVMAIAFHGRSQWRTFGEPSGGEASATVQVFLRDRALLNLTVGIDADRTGRAYGNKVEPDQAVAIDWALYESDKDPVILAALDWLRSQGTSG